MKIVEQKQEEYKIFKVFVRDHVLGDAWVCSTYHSEEKEYYDIYNMITVEI